MERKFVAPVSTFIAGLVLWIALVVLRFMNSVFLAGTPWLGTAVTIVIGILVLVTGLLCLIAGGPAAGQLVRLLVLLGLAVYAHFQVGAAAMIVVLIAAAGALGLTIRAFTCGGSKGQDTEA
jgi:hypothetical protein